MFDRPALGSGERFLDRLASAPAAVVFEGRPGIGKTTVWRQVLERGAARSHTVLSCRPVEAQTKLAFASIADLLEPVAGSILPRLPDPQRLALDVALLRTSAPGTPPSARAVATAVLSALRLLAGAAPLGEPWAGLARLAVGRVSGAGNPFLAMKHR